MLCKVRKSKLKLNELLMRFWRLFNNSYILLVLFACESLINLNYTKFVSTTHRKFPTFRCSPRKWNIFSTPALIFDISPATVSKTIHRIIPVLWHYFKNQVTWPRLNEWNDLCVNWHSFPNAVGCIDDTPHEIYCPGTEPQESFSVDIEIITLWTPS